MAGSIRRPIDMETERLIVRHLSPQDEAAFLSGIGDRELRRMYGLPLELSEERARQIFQRFSALPAAYGLIRKADDALIGFLLDVPSELPEDMQRTLPVGGRTLAYATFPPYQRQGYMREALLSMIRRHEADAPYLHGGHFPFNAPSERLLLSLGFREYGQHALGKATIIDKTRFFDG